MTSDSSTVRSSENFEIRENVDGAVAVDGPGKLYWSERWVSFESTPSVRLSVEGSCDFDGNRELRRVLALRVKELGWSCDWASRAVGLSQSFEFFSSIRDSSR